MTCVAPAHRFIAGLGLLFSLLLFSPRTAMAQASRPVISSCTATPSTIAPGGTTTVHVQATSPAGLPMTYTFTSTAGTVQSDGATATFTAASSATGTVPVLCEARSGQSWVRGRAYIKVVGTAVAGGAAAPKPTPAKPPSVASVPPPTVAKPAQPAPSQPAASKPTAPQPAPSQTTASKPPVTVTPQKQPPAPAPAQTKVTPPPPVPVPAPKTAPAPTPAQTTPAPQQTSQAPPQAAPTPQQTAPVVPPVVTTTPAPVQTGAETAQPSASTEAPTEWVTQSKDGLIEYAVPQKMIVGRASTVTVKIHGYSVAAGAMRGGSLTAQYLKVLLIAEDPHGLKIVSQGRADVQFVPRNKTTTWVWDVTPTGAAANQKLQVRVFEEYKTDTEQDVDGASYTVSVTKPSWLMLAREAYFGDQDAWWKYWLPSGVVCFLLLWLLLRLISPREKMPTGTARNYEASDWL